MTVNNIESVEEWERQADLFELGLKHAYQIAVELGVSPQTVSRRMKKMGAVKGSRVAETVEPLVDMLNQAASRRALLALRKSARQMRALEASSKAVGCMVAALLAADQDGEISLVAPVVDRMAQAQSGKRRKSR